MRKRQYVHTKSILLVLSLILAAAAILSVFVGRYSISPRDIVFALRWQLLHTGLQPDNGTMTVLFHVRLPRVAAAVLIGAALSASGCCYQGIFRNPMVSPDILGVSAGAGVGASLAILLSFNAAATQLLSFSTGLFAVCLTYLVSILISRTASSALSLILVGMVISALFNSIIALIKYMADPLSKLPAITFWLMGSLNTVSGRDLFSLFFAVVIGMTPLMALRWRINLLSFGEEEAKALGVNTSLLRIILIIGSTLITSTSVAVCGIVGWIGLIVPHAARAIVGPNYKLLLPASALMGGIFLLLVDNLARSLSTMELPLGILTSFIGAPFFLFLLVRYNRGWIQ